MAAREFEDLRRRHAHFFLSLAERAEPELRGAQQREWYARLLREEGNLRAALTWAVEIRDFDVALRLAGSLWMFWRWAGLFAEGRAWLDAALAGSRASALEVRCQGLWGAGWLAYHQGDYRRSGEVGAQMLMELGAGHDRERRNAQTLIGSAALAEGREKDAIEALSQAVALSQRIHGQWYEATSLLNLGTALMRAGRVAAANEHLGRALAIYEAIGDRHFVARTLIQIGYAKLLLSEPDRAAAAIGEAMTIVADIGDGWGIAEGMEAVATLRSLSHPRSAILLAAAAAKLRERISMRQHAADALINQQFLDRARHGMARDAFTDSWRMGRALTLDEAVGEALAPQPSSGSTS
jgi:tetratricopeptide (TPR) repeat protein